MDMNQVLDQAADLLAQSPATEWELAAAIGKHLSLSVRGPELDKFSQSTTQGVALRVIHQGRLGFSFLMGNDSQDLPRVVEEALASAVNSDLKQECCLAGPAPEIPQLKLFDPSVLEDPLEAKKERALAMAQAALDADSRVVHVHPAEVEEQVSQVWYRTSNGLDKSFATTTVGAGCVAMAQQGDEQEAEWDSRTVRFLSELDTITIGKEAGMRAAASLGGAPIKDGRYEILFDNRIAAQLLSLVSESFRGDNVVKGRSLMADKIGQKLFSGCVHMMDDGLYPGGLGSSPLDGEGTVQQKKTLVKAGEVAGFVYDRYWATRAGTHSTGNSVRTSLKTPPEVGYHNLHLIPGKLSPTEAMAQMRQGVWITEIMGGHTADPVSGEFSFGAAGRLIKNGRLAEPVKSMAMAGRIFDLFNSVNAVCNDLRFFGTTGSPSLWVSGVSLSGAEQS
jgi:PmbA protein